MGCVSGAPKQRVASVGKSDSKASKESDSIAPPSLLADEDALEVQRQRIAEMERELARAKQEMVLLSGGRTRTRSGFDEVIVPTDEARAFGAPLGQVLAALGAQIALVSTPQFGPGPGEGEFKLPVMGALERAASFCFPTLVAAYDFKGAASTQECAEHLPDCEMVGARAHEWQDTVKVEATQWCRFWGGRVRGTVSSLVLGATPLPKQVKFQTCKKNSFALFPAQMRVLFVFSIQGGPVTQTEFRLLPRLLKGTVADLSTRELDLGGTEVLWVHFDSLEDCLKALQGYGGLDMLKVQEAFRFDRPGRWTDGPFNAAFDLLKAVPGATPEARRAYLAQARAPEPGLLNDRLLSALDVGAAGRVEELLAARADPNHTASSGFRAIYYAISNADPVCLTVLRDHGADMHAKSNHGQTPLQYAKKDIQAYERDEAGLVQARIDATMALLS